MTALATLPHPGLQRQEFLGNLPVAHFIEQEFDDVVGYLATAFVRAG